MPRVVNHSIFLSLCAVVVLVVWMLSGYLAGGSTDDNSGVRASDGDRGTVVETQARDDQKLMKVQVSTSVARPVARKIEIQGQLEPLRSVNLRAETEGRVIEIKARKGLRVSQGDVILVLAMNDRQARLEEAEASVRHLQARLEATRKLKAKGYADDVTIMEIEAALASARAELENIELEIRNTRITAPFAGIVNDRSVEMGDYVRGGDQVATVVDDHIMLASGYLPQQSIGRISVGQPATVTVFTGEEREGTVTYISAQSGNESRTFRVEVKIPNPDYQLTAGLSTRLTLTGGMSDGHFVSPSILSLGPEEQLGVKVVGEANRVEFYPVQIVRTEMNGIWVTGLPQRVSLITMGQGYVSSGEEVIPVSKTAATGPAATPVL